MQAAPNGSKKTGLIVAAVIIVAAVAVLVWWQRSGMPESVPAPTTGTPEATTTVADTPAAINESLENIDIGNLEQEFQTIDNDMKAL